MEFFDFSLDVVNKTIKELCEAEKFIRIAIFQLHNREIFDVLNQKLQDGIKVEIFTLPYDSINDEIRARVEADFDKLLKNGANLHFCKWNIGDPGRTTTAVGRWYSYHGKFIVTDKSAISLSANFTDQCELDAVLIYKNDPRKVSEYNTKFDDLVQMFVLPEGTTDKSIKNIILKTNYPNVENLFALPKSIQQNHKDFWITDYPTVICPNDINFNDRLLICPFDIKARNLIIKLINEADKYIYLSTESFTDIDIIDNLIIRTIDKIDIRILTGSVSMDYTDRIQDMLRKLVASGISVHTIEEEIHAKLLISDKRVTLSSINLNKINLGFGSSVLWRGNTETATISKNKEIIESAKSQYESVFNKGNDISIKLIEKLKGEAKNIFTNIYRLKSSDEVKVLFSRLILNKEIDIKKFTLRIGGITTKLMKAFNQKIVNKEYFLMALILYYLSERKMDIDQLQEKIRVLNTQMDLSNLITKLMTIGYIEKEEDYFKLSVESLFNGK